MADNVNDSLKNLNQNIKDADANLAKLSKDFNVTFTEAVNRAARDAKVSIDQMFDAIAGRVGASKASKLKLLFDIVDEHGKTATPQTIQQKIDRIVNATPTAKGTKLHIGMDWVDADKANANLRRYKEQLKLIQDMPSAYDLVMRSVNAINAGFAKEEAARKRIIAQNEKILNQLIKEEEKERAITREIERRKAKERNKLVSSNTSARLADEKRATQMIAAEYRARERYAAEREKYIRNLESSNHLARVRDEQKSTQMINAEYKRREKEAERHKRQIESTNRSLESMLPTLRRLASAFGVAFSIQGLVQFGKKLVETRGEFEMQFVAMKQIIGDVDAATKIWNQTMQQALQSPFRAMQLVDYTKKLAAYRIETDKLFDTTKRLADVSAGLGVDMGRLILAYGQVKTANYLRASEVRQFTEAGVNIYGELAKYFSEIEGRAVGTAEVVERVSKRMVLFSDVEKIFQRMTDEGGVFFNMQEVQADTVRGQIMKLHDAYDQMLNTIGQANQGTIRNLLETLNDLVRNWQNVAFVLKGNVNLITIIGAALYALSRGGLKVATDQTLWFAKSMGLSSKTLLKSTADVRIFSRVLGDYTLKQRLAIVAVRTFQGALVKLGSVISAIWPILAFEGVVLLIERLTRANRELKRFREELESVTSDNVGRMNEEISGYDALIKKLKKTNEGTAARKEILDEISNKYGKYLDFIVTEKTTVEELAGAYDNVVSSIRNYTAAKIREEQMQRVEKGIYDEYQDLISNLIGSRNFNTDTGLSKDQAKAFAKYVQSSVKEGITDSKKIIEDYFKIELPTSANTPMMHFVRTYIDQYKNLYSELQDIRDDIEGVTPVFESEAEYEDYKNRVQAANAALAEQAKRNEQINNLIKENNKEQWQTDDALSKQRIANAEAELRIRRKYNLITQKEYESSLARLNGQLDDYETDYNRRLKESLQSMSSFGPFWLTLDKDARDMYNYVVSTEDALQQGTEQRNKQLKESYKGLKDSLKQYQDALAAGGDKDTLNKNITWTKLMIKAIELAAKLRGIDLTDNKEGGTARNYDSISSLISLLKEMNSEYDKLSKSAYGFAKSNEKVRESFSDAFAEIFGFAGIDINQVDTTSKSATVKAMELVKKTLDDKNMWGRFGKDGGKKARAEFEKALAGMRAEVDIELTTRKRENVAKQLEDAFSDFQLTLDLEKLQLPSGLLKDMFDIDGTDLAAMRQKLEDLSKDLTDENGVMTGDNLKLYEQWLKKLDDEERKLQQQRLKDYSKYLEYQLSNRAKLEMEYVRKVADVQSEIAYDDTTRQRILDGLRKEYEKNIAKQDWEDFKGSEMYIEMMEDLTKQGTAALEEMRKKLLEVRDNAENLYPRELKEVINALEKIDETIYGRMTPFQAVRELRKQAREAMNENGVMDISEAFERDRAAKEEYEEHRKLHEQLEQEIADKQKLKDISEQLGDVRYEEVEDLRKRQKSAQQNLKDEQEHLKLLGIRTKENEIEYDNTLRNINIYSGLSDQYQKQIDLLTQYQSISKKLANSEFKDKSLKDLLSMSKEELDAMGLSEEEMKNIGEILKYWKLMRQAELKALDEVKEYLSLIQNIAKNTSDMLHTLGVEQNPLSDYWEQATDAAFSYAQETIEAIKQFKEAKIQAEAISGAGEDLMTENYIKLALRLLGVLLQVVNQIGLFRGARIDNEIMEEQEYIDELSMAYDRLEKAIAKTVTTSDYLNNYNKQIQNTYQQIAATQAQLAAAQSRKNVDQSEVNGYRSALYELYDQLEDLQNQMQETFGGIGGRGNYRSWAEEFVSEWRSAFLETGDGFDALEDHFDEFLQSWFEKQATMRIAAKMLDPLMSMIDQSVDDGLLTRMELDRIKERASEIFPQLNEQLREFYETMGFGDAYGSLSGLAQAISGMTEEQADILAAYWNSVRMHTASIDINVAAIANALGVGAGIPESNPMLQQIRIVARNTANINSLLESVVKPGHSQGRSGIKVFLN